MKLRVLIDQGSMSDLITERAATLLLCKRQNVNVTIRGIGGNKNGLLKHQVLCVISSATGNDAFKLPIKALVTKHITNLPKLRLIDLEAWPHIKNLQMADPWDQSTQRIDMLLRARTFAQLLEEGLIKGNDNEPIAQKTKIGWILSGSYPTRLKQSVQCNILSITDDQLPLLLRRFWEIEEVSIPSQISSDDICL